MAGSRENSRTTSEPPGSYELFWLLPLFSRESQKSSYEPGGSDVVRELSVGSPSRGFELEWTLVATSLEGVFCDWPKKNGTRGTF